MTDNLTLEKAKRLAQARLNEWSTPDRECFIESVTPFEHGWILCHAFWLFDHGLKRKGYLSGFGGHNPLVVFRTGEVIDTLPMPLDVMGEILSRDWEAAHAPHRALELSQEAEGYFARLFNSVFSHILHLDTDEVRLERDGVGLGISWRGGGQWKSWGQRPFFAGALIARRLKLLADISPAEMSDLSAMQSGFITVKSKESRYKKVGGQIVKQDGRSIWESRDVVWNVSLTVFPTPRGEQVVLGIALDEATSSWAEALPADLAHPNSP